ncbi:hypothetical protein GGX14DRAFT_375297 [Mycena pura]|uniref:Vacuolar import and degradation protein 21 n=1 Tax=Mycena pura TaxID=153505 RepID=A0AAD6V1E3_9AGAR|nr:hypothetical protein GGX14DRAFT_375297 [Mycena pura]
MVIDEEDDETQPEPPPVLRVDDPPAVAPVLDIEPPDQESTAQPTATTVPALPILIPEPVSTFGPPVVLDFSTVSPQQASPEPPATPSDSQHGYRLTYTLPPLKVLPADFSRKTKTGKQQRKHKERDKGGDKAKEKDDWTPLGVSRWGAMLRANPVYPKVSRAPKCLSTREWSVAMAELRLMRALEQVESLKDSGRWSFRQPKKQRGVGGLTKTHWDHVLDEMKWMRTDFREERKWKLALAYHISTAVLEWHCFSSLAERVEKGICVGWRPPRDDEKPTTDVTMEDSSALTKISAHSGSLLGVDYGSDDDDDDEQEKQSVIDALEPSSVLDDALDAAGKGPDTVMSDSGFENIEFKRAEDSEEPHSAPREATSEMDVDEEGDSEKPSTIKMEETEDQGVGEQETQPSGLKDSSSDPTLSQTDSLGTIGEPSVSTTPVIKTSSKNNIYAPLREYLAYSDPDKSFIDLHDLDRVVMNASADELSADLAFPPADLSKIFPDLPPMGMLDVAPPPTANISEGRTKKSEKRADRDDPNKRVEETMYTKLFPIGRFMYTKPTLIGPLQPAKRWKNGQWLPADDCPALDPDTPIVKVQDSLSDLFNPKFANPPKLLEQLKEKEAKETPKRVSTYMWTAVDDSLLKSLADKYPNNWSLISECYNSARVRISTDKRTARDCQERWKERFALELTPKPQEATTIYTDEPQGTPLPPPTPSMTTRGIKRLASASVSGPPPVASGSDAKKRRRHQYLVECIRKAGKKRSEQAQKMLNNQRKPSATHETHAQYTRLPKYSPAELSRLKAEKEFKDQQDLLAARRKHEEMTRAQQQRLQTGQPTQGQAASAPQGQSQAAPPAPIQQQQAAQQQQQQQLQQLQAAVAQQQRLTATAVAAARGQVNISQQQQQQHQQQQRIASPLAGNPRLPLTQQQQQHQLLQHRLAAQQALLHQQQALAAQAAAGSSTGANNAVVNGVRPGTSSPRPPASVPAAPGNALQRQYLNMNMNMVQNLQATGYTSEQLQQMVRIKNKELTH